MNTPITLYVPKKMKRFLEKLAEHRSKASGEKVTISAVVREAIAWQFAADAEFLRTVRK